MNLLYLLIIPLLISVVLGAFALTGVVIGVLLRRSGRRRSSLFFFYIPCCAAVVALLFGWVRVLDTGDILGFLVGLPLGATGGLVLALALRGRFGSDSV